MFNVLSIEFRDKYGTVIADLRAAYHKAGGNCTDHEGFYKKTFITGWSHDGFVSSVIDKNADQVEGLEKRFA